MIGSGPTKLLRWLAPLLLVLATAMQASSALAAQETTSATVSATSSLNIRSCPELACEIVATAKLGDHLTITGEAESGFLPVRFRGETGFAFSIFVAQENAEAPWFVQGDASCQRVAMIFNIGVGHEPSQEIADTLVGTGTPATMFPMGTFATAHPEYLQMLERNGFLIGTHGDQPLSLPMETDEVVEQDIVTSVQTIEGVIGRPIDQYFTPYAAVTDERVRGVVSDLGLLPVGWNVTAGDFGPDVTEDIVYDRIMSEVTPGAIIEMHLDGPATSTSTALALPRIIEDLRAEGYEIVTVPELMLPCAGVN